MADKKIPAASSVVVKKTPVKKVVEPVAAKTKAVAKPVEKKPKKEAKIKVVRDSFTMPHDEYQQIAAIKQICLEAGVHVKKSEVLRAGLFALSVLTATQLKKVIGSLEKIKTGRPKKH